MAIHTVVARTYSRYPGMVAKGGAHHSRTSSGLGCFEALPSIALASACGAVLFLPDSGSPMGQTRRSPAKLDALDSPASTTCSSTTRRPTTATSATPKNPASQRHPASPDGGDRGPNPGPSPSARRHGKTSRPRAAWKPSKPPAYRAGAQPARGRGWREPGLPAGECASRSTSLPAAVYEP